MLSKKARDVIARNKIFDNRKNLRNIEYLIKTNEEFVIDSIERLIIDNEILLKELDNMCKEYNKLFNYYNTGLCRIYKNMTTKP